MRLDGHRPSRTFALAILLAATLTLATTASAGPRKDMVARAGIIGLTITNLGYVGNGLSDPGQPSCEYPLNGNVEHLFLGGLWVGAVTADGTIRVSTGAQDVSNLVAGDNMREFENFEDPEDPNNDYVWQWSNSQNSDNYHPSALATQHIECIFDDDTDPESGTHVPMGLKVILRALAWGSPYADDFVILDYTIINVSGTELSEVYVGFWNDTTVGNTLINNPYDSSQGSPWNYYDDVNGAWRPGDVDGDAGIWMMYEHDDDGDDGMATSWIGNRLLGTVPEVEAAEGNPPVSYNVWGFRGVPANDDTYIDPDTLDESPGKYQLMGNGEFDVGEQEFEDFTRPHDWIALLSTGPFPYMAPNDTIHVTYALTCGADSLSLLANSRVAQVAYDTGFQIATGPPSPRLEVAYADNSVILSWVPGDSLGIDDDGEPYPLPADDPRRSPEHHISVITGREDFQGYRVYRYLGEDFTGDPNLQSTLIAEFDRIDGFGFDTGLPPLDGDGKRSFTDTSLLDGFAYWYSVVSFSAPDLNEGLPSFQSGFYENARKVYPGPAPVPAGSGRGVGVYPNPYRAGSYFDGQYGERELNRKIWFTGLPERCTIKIFNLAGDLVQMLRHDDPASGMEAWDILSDPVRAIATGLYVYVVENPADGSIQRGKLVVIK
ncbi:hypothetical protein KKA85_15280 [bacterium]|nr:hypothetical protein [bacterium]MBU1677131.1 hypothetical protein [bacterium]